MAPRDASTVQGMANNAIDLYEKFRTHMPARDAERRAVSISAQVANATAGVRVEDAKRIAQDSISEYRGAYNRVASAVTHFFTDSRKPLSESAQERAVQRVSERHGEVPRRGSSASEGGAPKPEQGRGFDRGNFARRVIDNYVENRKQMGRSEAVARTVTFQAYAAERNGGVSRKDASQMADAVIKRYREATQSMTAGDAREAVAKSMSGQGRAPNHGEGRAQSQQIQHKVPDRGQQAPTKVQQVAPQMRPASRSIGR